MSKKETDITEQDEAQANKAQAADAQAVDISVEPVETEADAEQTIEDDLVVKLAEAEAKAQDNWDQLLRTRAEMDNLRRRTERELENAHKYALERFAQELLAVRDSLEMGLSVGQGENIDVSNLLEGTELTLKMLVSAMEKFAIKELNPLDEPFDPEQHQAMSMLEAPDKAPNTVINVMQKGYSLNDRLIRPAMVVVSKASSAAVEDEKGSNVDEQA